MTPPPAELVALRKAVATSYGLDKLGLWRADQALLARLRAAEAAFTATFGEDEE